ncbi:MAG TPA: hypothetical protein VEQ59_04215 [Polyangiaceae bacterium]|nr:hypothetical protein [Polyangiaceae bacterium]
MAAAYLPVYCTSCAHASLTPIHELMSELRCSFCEATARVIPGPTYGDGDWLAFAEIDKALSEAELSGPEASALADELQSLLDALEPVPNVVQRMIERVPALASVRPALVNRPPRGPRMLATLLGARTRELGDYVAASQAG